MRKREEGKGKKEKGRRKKEKEKGIEPQYVVPGFSRAIQRK
jgi:hypothetical protein